MHRKNRMIYSKIFTVLIYYRQSYRNSFFLYELFKFSKISRYITFSKIKEEPCLSQTVKAIKLLTLQLIISSQLYLLRLTNQMSFTSLDFRVAIIHFTVKLYLASMMNIILRILNNQKMMGRIPFSIIIIKTKETIR